MCGIWSGCALSAVQTRSRSSGIRTTGHRGNGPTANWLRDAAGLAAGLQRRGIGPGDRVLIHLENCPEFVIAWYACAAIGAVAVTTNTRSAADEMRYFIEDSQPACAITQPRFAEMIAACAPQLKWQAVLDGNPDEEGTTSHDDDSFTSLAARSRRASIRVRPIRWPP